MLWLKKWPVCSDYHKAKLLAVRNLSINTEKNKECSRLLLRHRHPSATTVKSHAVYTSEPNMLSLQTWHFIYRFKERQLDCNLQNMFYKGSERREEVRVQHNKSYQSYEILNHLFAYVYLPCMNLEIRNFFYDAKIWNYWLSYWFGPAEGGHYWLSIC